MGICTPKISSSKSLWGKMASERLFNSFIPPQKKLLYSPKQISAYPPALRVIAGEGTTGAIAPNPPPSEILRET